MSNKILDEQTVAKIRELYKILPIYVLVKRFGVSRTTIVNVLKAQHGYEK